MTQRWLAATACAFAMFFSAHVAAAEERRALHWDTIVHAPVQDVWDAFTTREGLESWMVPRADVDLRIDGMVRTNHNAAANPDDAGWSAHRILAYEPLRMISTRAASPEDAPEPEVARASWNVIRFESLSDRLTRVTIVACGWGEGSEWDAAAQRLREGNAWAFERLQQRFPPPTEHAAASAPDAISRAAISLRFLENPIVAEKVIPASRADVWRTLTTSEGLESFFAQRAIVDLRMGGLYELHFLPDAPPGHRGADDCHVLAYVPEELLAISWNAPPPFPPERAERTFVVFRLEDAPGGATLVRLHHGGWREGADWDKVRAYFVRVWPHVLDALATRLQTSE